MFVELVPNGGAFGGKEDMTIQAQTALLARLTGKPVRIELNREESMRIHPKRHPITMNYTVGCDAEGRLTAARINILGDSGAYASVGGKVIERAAGHACGPYRIPAIDIDAVAVYTNNPPCGAMRGFGVNQTSFAIEGCLDVLARKVGIDGWEMRWRNAVRIGDVFSSGQVLDKSRRPGTDAAGGEGHLLRRTQERAGGRPRLRRQELRHRQRRHRKRQVPAGGGGRRQRQPVFRLHRDGTGAVHRDHPVRGRSHRPAGFGVPPQGDQPVRTGQRPDHRIARHAVGGPGHHRRRREAQGRPRRRGIRCATWSGAIYEGETTIDDTTAPGQTKNGIIKTHTSFGWASQVVVLDETGAVDLVHVAQDVGRAINPQQCEAQIEGAVAMGLGYALTEELPCKDGMPVTFKVREHRRALRAPDMPRVEVTLVEEHEPEGPFGAKGIGELGLVPTAGAVAAALEAFDGVRRMTLPMKDSAAARAIDVGRIKDGDRAQWH